MVGLERAIAIAVEAHAGQFDKGGAPYILHPLRVMFALPPGFAQVVGVLHDVVEDDPQWTLERLRIEGFPDEVVEAVGAVTRRDGEEYADFIQRCAKNKIGRRVKEADIADNLDIGRIPYPSDADWTRQKRYRKALVELQNA